MFSILPLMVRLTYTEKLIRSKMAQINISKTNNPNIPPTGREGIFIDTEGIMKAIDDEGNQRVIQADKRIEFFEPEQENNFTITASMLFKLVYINSATDVEVTVDNMVVGSWIPFDTLGAGLPVFVDGVGDNIFTDEDFTGATSFILIRLEDDGATERYGVKYG